ncbi:MAG TPA: Mur ligase family protein [Acidimicrobiia bacterium]|nr:Mur ligase family protein [Acidimicrobiia bacterium]
MTPERDVRAWLDSHVNLERMVGVPSGSTRRVAPEPLSRMESLIELLGSPQLQYPVIHITGTNGKTTVARIATALLVADGLSVGTDTSPYLERFNERMSWNGEPIPDDELDRLLAHIASIEDLLPQQPSYFEIVHGAALEWFADVAVDVAVIEVGLGGLWDATNVVDGQVAVVTNVELDHVEYLGNSRAEIAREKAGIVKPDATLVLGETDPELVPLFLANRPERVILRDRDFGVTANRLAVGGRVLDLFTPWGAPTDVFLPLHGAHQGDNAAIALAAAEAFLGRALDPDVIADAFASVSSPGRLEVVARDPLVVIDGTKNVAGAHAVRAALDEEFPAPSDGGVTRTWVVGILMQKDPHEMLGALGVRAGDRVIATRPEIPRAREPREVADAALALGVAPDHIEVVDAVADAVRHAIDTSDPIDQVVVAGSLYVAGPARSALVR